MDFIQILLEPAILIITTVFLFFIMTVLKNYQRTENSLKSVYTTLQSINKKEVSYRFNQLDEFMINNSYTTTCWEDFKKALIYPEKLFTASQAEKTNNLSTPEI